MTDLVFNGNEKMTIGAEVEVQLIDPETHGLSSSFPELFKEVPEEFRPFFKEELIKSNMEITSKVCKNVAELEDDLRRKYDVAFQIAEKLNFELGFAGTHPYARWSTDAITPNPRYLKLVDNLQFVARQMLIFGLHIHVAVDGGDKAVKICNHILPYLPILLAFSANSPFWKGEDSGMHSIRSKIFEGLPTAGVPSEIADWNKYRWLVKELIDTNFISSFRELWWDVRPHPGYGTIEVRACDCPATLPQILGLAALIQAITRYLSDRIDSGEDLPRFHPILMEQNKWQAGRYGIHGNFIDIETSKVISAKDACYKALEQFTPYCEELGSKRYLPALYGILEKGTSADIQLQVYKDTNDLVDVTKDMVARSKIY